MLAQWLCTKMSRRVSLLLELQPQMRAGHRLDVCIGEPQRRHHETLSFRRLHNCIPVDGGHQNKTAALLRNRFLLCFPLRLYPTEPTHLLPKDIAPKVLEHSAALTAIINKGRVGCRFTQSRTAARFDVTTVTYHERRRHANIGVHSAHACVNFGRQQIR